MLVIFISINLHTYSVVILLRTEMLEPPSQFPMVVVAMEILHKFHKYFYRVCPSGGGRWKIGRDSELSEINGYGLTAPLRLLIVRLVGAPDRRSAY